MTSLIHLDIGGGVARLFIDRPARRNAFNQSMWEALPALVDTAMADRAVRLLIVQAAAPGPFSAGADISEFAECSRDPAWRRANQIAMRTTQVTLVKRAQADHRAGRGRLHRRRLRNRAGMRPARCDRGGTLRDHAG